MFFRVRQAPNVAIFSGEIHLRYGDESQQERFLVRYSCGADLIVLEQWDGSSYSPTLPRDRDAAEIYQVLRDADAVAAPLPYTIWGRADKAFRETLAERASDSAHLMQLAQEAHVA